MRRNLTFIILLQFCLLPSWMLASERVDSLLERLDRSLDRKAEFEKKKTDRIASLRNVLEESKDLRVKYETQRQLFEEYKAYRYDSSAVSAQRCLDIALALGDADCILQSKCNIAFSYVAAGITMEANNLLSALDVSNASLEVKRSYYFNYYKLWREEADRLHDTPLYDPYIRRSGIYLDSLISLTPKNSPEWYNYMGSRHMRKHEFKEALEKFDKYLSSPGLSDHAKAMAYAERAWAYRWLDDTEMATENFALSAIYDNESATREITALYLLANILDDQYSDRSIRYIRMALDDVTFYEARQRKLELGEILPKLEQERYNAISAQRNTYLLLAIMAVCLLALVIVVVIFVRRKNVQLQMAQKRIEEHLEQIRLTNEQLVEANKIKVEYIGQSFYMNADFIAKLEKLYKGIERQITTHQYDKVKDTVNPKNLDKERRNMYAAFDATFLNLFPNFVEEYNNLFEESDRRVPEIPNTLTSEMRIFALIRLGINDSERISHFLGYSIHTVNTYKTRIKNRAKVDNDQFERLIMSV